MEVSYFVPWVLSLTSPKLWKAQDNDFLNMSGSSHNTKQGVQKKRHEEQDEVSYFLQLWNAPIMLEHDLLDKQQEHKQAEDEVSCLLQLDDEHQRNGRRHQG